MSIFLKIEESQTPLINVQSKNLQGVALLPESAFGMKSRDLVARLSYVDFEDSFQKKNFDLIRDCLKVVEGIKAIKYWFLKL